MVIDVWPSQRETSEIGTLSTRAVQPGRDPLTTTRPASATHPALDPEGIEFVGETDTLLTMCSCAASSSSPYQG